MNLAPVTLAGRGVRLEPLARQHVPALWAACTDPEPIFRWFAAAVAGPADMAAFVEAALADQAAGRALPFATVRVADGAVVGSTRYCNIEEAHRRVEIGFTWLTPAAQRTAINTEAKLLMLRHAFETLGVMRVEFKTDALNVKSRAALLRIGAREEGTFRKHMLCSTGRIRDSVYFSITDDEWPAVRSRLQAMMDGREART